MRKVLHWRKATWALVVWSGYLATWMVLTGSGPAIVVLWWLLGLGLLQLIVQPLHQTGSIEPSRRHGPFDPRFSPPPDPPLPLATNDDLTATPEQADTGADRRQKNAVHDWESEGGAIAEPPRANPTAQAA
jgi:hypothetical protein